MRKIAVMNQKGGVGKTTTTINLAHAMAMAGSRVLCIDLDPQAHLGMSFGPQHGRMPGIDEVLIDDADIRDYIVEVRERLDIVPAGPRLAEFETTNAGGARRGWLLAQALKPVRRRYDMVLVDCPPSAGMLGMNALFACTEVIVPVSGDVLAQQDLSRKVDIVDAIDEALKRMTKRWFDVTRFHERRRLANEVRETVMKHFSGQVLPTPVRESVALAESPGFGKTIFEYQGKGRGAEDYRALAQDFICGRTC